MASALWYYQDRDANRVGPVSAEAVIEAARNGMISPASLVWCEGMPEWIPLQSAAAELGLAVPPTLPSPLGTALMEVVPAGFIRRWAALFIDGLVLMVPVTLIVFGVILGARMAGMDAGTQGSAEAASPLLTVVIYAVYFLASALYFAGMESSKHQATLGKIALGIKVSDNEGRRLSFSHALGRWFSTSLSYLTLYIGFLMAAFTERKRALHDMVSGTLVVDRWAYTDSPQLQKRSASGCLLAFVVGVLLVIPMVAILAAISISQYQDYVVRAQVSEGPSLAEGVKTAIGEYYNAKGTYPATNEAAGLPTPAQISGAYVSAVDIGNGNGEIRISYSARPPQKANASIDGAMLEMTPLVQNGSMSWTCHSSSIKQKDCPRVCACQ